jgi:hypothetical protein
MSHLDIALTLDMIKMLVEGEPIGFTIPDLDLAVTLRCEASVAKNFRDTVNDALLHLLPGPPGIH